MSTNCIICIKNKRTSPFDCLCDECREKETAKVWICNNCGLTHYNMPFGYRCKCGAVYTGSVSEWEEKLHRNKEADR